MQFVDLSQRYSCKHSSNLLSTILIVCDASSQEYRSHIRPPATLSEFHATYVRDLELALLSKQDEDKMMHQYKKEAGGMLELMLNVSCLIIDRPDIILN